MKKRYPISRICASSCLLMCLLAIPAAASPTKLYKNDFDIEQCQTWQDDQTKSASRNEIVALFGLERREGRAWSAGHKASHDAKPTFGYQVSFKRPQRVAAVFFVGSPRIVKVLKSGAAYPGDVQSDDDWLVLPITRGESGARLVVLPEPIETRALVFTGGQPWRHSTLESVRVFEQPTYNITPGALAYAESEYTRYSQGAPPYTYRASNVTLGRGEWRNTGDNPRGRITRPPISRFDPSWFVLSWREPRTIHGLWMLDNFKKFTIQVFTGDANVNPRVGKGSEWETIARPDVSASHLGRQNSHWYWFKPVKTRGIRIQITESNENKIAMIAGLHVFSDRKYQPDAAEGDQPDMPVQLSYGVPENGRVTLVVNDAEGRRIRNVFARQTREAGEHKEGWNLKGEAGVIVKPGTYHWTAMYHAPLEHKYHGTVYPNVTAHGSGNSPWLNSKSGPGGWMADHTPPRAGCVAGGRVFLGAPVAESGVSLIEVDSQGHKQWGHHSFAGFTGAWFLAGDAKDVYVGAFAHNAYAGWGVDRRTEAFWRVNVESKEVTLAAKLEPTDKRQRGLKGMAARDGKVYLSINGNRNWLNNAASLAAVDAENCWPKYKPKRAERMAHEIVPDLRNDFARLFRLTGKPAGGGASGGVNLIWLESTQGRSSQQHIMLTFKRPVELGSVVLPIPQKAPYRIKLSVLKPDAPYPPNPAKASMWQDFEVQPKHAWDVAVAPPDTRTRALRITFFTGEDDMFDQLAAEAEFESGKTLDTNTALGGQGTAWKGKIEGAKLLPRRYRNVTPEAEVRVNSGIVNSKGEWDAKRRNRPLTPNDPGRFMLEWQKARPIRGLAIKEIDGKRTLIDVFVGDGPAKLDSDQGWEQVGEYLQSRRDHHSGFPSYNGKARYLDGYVDFGRTIQTRAVRLRVVEQWADNGKDADGVRDDLGGTNLNASRCRIWGVAALEHLGGEPPVDPLISQRIEVMDGHSGKIVDEVYVDRSGSIAFNTKGQLFAVSHDQVVRINWDGASHETIIRDLKRPGPIAIDSKGNLYVFESEPGQHVVRVYDAKGKHLRSIGTPGGIQVGPWDKTRLGQVSAMAIDAQDQLWIVETQYWPKRITRWTTSGEFKAEYLGNTAYGGGGCLDPWQPTRLFYGSLEFEVDINTGLSKLKAVTWPNGHQAGETPIQIEGRTYLVTRPQWSRTGQPCGIVYLFDEQRHVARRVAAMGRAAAFHPLTEPDLHTALGSPVLKQHWFHWSDQNEDGRVDADEVTLFENKEGRSVSPTIFARDLSLTAGRWQWHVKSYLPRGTPVYDVEQLPIKADTTLRLNDGSFHRFGFDADKAETGLAPDGSTIWTYPSERAGTHGYAEAKPYSEEQIAGHYTWVGHETAHAGDLGEFVVLSGNSGTWHLLTADGILAGRLFEDLRLRPKSWSMPEHDHGMSLNGVTIGQEHFSGYFCRTKDNRYFAVAGHNHISLVEILGLDRFKRIKGTLEVTPEMIQATQQWEQSVKREELFERAPVIVCGRLNKSPRIDGDISDWAEPVALMGQRDKFHGGLAQGAQLYMGFTDKRLIVAFETAGLGPLKNSGEQWDQLFKTGAAVDLQLATDPKAKDDRRAPTKGDIRLLLTFANNEPQAVLYEAIVPGTSNDDRWLVVSPTGSATFDRVQRLKGVIMETARHRNGYVVEASIPLDAIGLNINTGERYKFDWGVLVSDNQGHQVLRRDYWANKATAIVADTPSEARLHPDLWGHVIFKGKAAGKAQPTIGVDALEGGDSSDAVDDFLDEID